jgi:hypothetical protein
METRRQGDMEAWRHGDMETYGDMETWRRGNVETWRHGDMETWRHGDIDMETSNGKWKTEAQAPVCSSCKLKFVVFPFVDESHPFANGLNGLAHGCKKAIKSFSKY